MNKSFIKFFDKIIVVLLGVVGLSGMLYSCMKYGMPPPPPEYVKKHELRGVVTDKETSNPIKHIQVTLQIKPEYRIDTLYTSSFGGYNHGFGGFPLNSPVHIKFEDIDGEENGGEFETKEMDIKFTEADRVEKGDGKWNEGKFVKTVNIELEHKK